MWIKLCDTFASRFDGDIRRLFDENDNDIDLIKRYVQLENKKAFPYLSGVKICNYWLYVIHQYTDRKFRNLDALTVQGELTAWTYYGGGLQFSECTADSN